jgi:hypothetical protein
MNDENTIRQNAQTKFDELKQAFLILKQRNAGLEASYRTAINTLKDLGPTISTHVNEIVPAVAEKIAEGLSGDISVDYDQIKNKVADELKGTQNFLSGIPAIVNGLIGRNQSL